MGTSVLYYYKVGFVKRDNGIASRCVSYDVLDRVVWAESDQIINPWVLAGEVGPCQLIQRGFLLALPK